LNTGIKFFKHNLWLAIYDWVIESILVFVVFQVIVSCILWRPLSASFTTLQRFH